MQLSYNPGYYVDLKLHMALVRICNYE